MLYYAINNNKNKNRRFVREERLSLYDKTEWITRFIN